MTLEQRLELEILQHIADWKAAPYRPCNEASLDFYYVVAELKSLAKLDEPDALKVERLRNALDDLLEQRHLDGRMYGGGMASCRLTALGYGRLETLRQLVGWRRAATEVRRVMGKGFAQVIVPIVVSVLTVLVTQKLGLSE